MADDIEGRLALIRLVAAALLTLAILAGAFVLLLRGEENLAATALAVELPTIIITAWITYFAASARR